MQPSMTLHWSPRSPYVRKVMIVAHELGLAPRIRTVRTVVGGTTPHRGLMRINPLGKLPTLECDDGTVLYDSPVICEYLDTLHDGPRLFPAAGPARFTALRRQALGDGMLDAALPWLSERFRPPERQSIPHMALWRAKLEAAVEALETEAPALAADPFGIGQIAIGVALGYLDFRFPELAWRDGHGALAGWYEGFAARPAVAANPPVDDR
ncbi:MAG: glutathione S-transferase family protein [Acetobacteraceae bacterium]